MAPKSELVRVLTERGYLHQCTDLEALDALASTRPIPAYIGFDLTADSLHVGSLLQIMLLRRLQQTGHKPVVLMGGGTTRIGDPSGKDTSRTLLSAETIASNTASIKRIFDRYLTFGDGPSDAVMVDNGAWLNQLNYIDFLRDYGSHFTINRMLTFDSVRLRLDREQPLTFLEFNYMILQAYDFLELGRRLDCRMQFGGSDQWGNIVNGVELNRRVDGREVFGFTSPLLTTASGAKMGKTAAGAVWLNEDRLATFDFWQFWRNTEDADVGRFLRLFTDLPLDEVVRLERLQGAEINQAKIVLATAVTTLCRGGEAADERRSNGAARLHRRRCRHRAADDRGQPRWLGRGYRDRRPLGPRGSCFLQGRGKASYPRCRRSPERRGRHRRASPAKRGQLRRRRQRTPLRGPEASCTAPAGGLKRCGRKVLPLKPSLLVNGFGAS